GSFGGKRNCLLDNLQEGLFLSRGGGDRPRTNMVKKESLLRHAFLSLADSTADVASRKTLMRSRVGTFDTRILTSLSASGACRRLPGYISFMLPPRLRVPCYAWAVHESCRRLAVGTDGPAV